jgi:hypothetical protein
MRPHRLAGGQFVASYDLLGSFSGASQRECRRFLAGSDPGFDQNRLLRNRSLRCWPDWRRRRRQVAGLGEKPFFRSRRPPAMQAVTEVRGGKAAGPDQRPRSTRQQDGHDSGDSGCALL